MYRQDVEQLERQIESLRNRIHDRLDENPNMGAIYRVRLGLSEERLDKMVALVSELNELIGGGQ